MTNTAPPIPLSTEPPLLPQPPSTDSQADIDQIEHRNHNDHDQIETPLTTITTLPGYILPSIFELINYTPSLKNCHLACREWSSWIKPQIWQNITIPFDLDSSQRFIKLVNSDRKKWGYIHSITSICDSYTASEELWTEFELIIRKSVNLRKILLPNFVGHIPVGIKLALHCCGKLVMLDMDFIHLSILGQISLNGGVAGASTGTSITSATDLAVSGDHSTSAARIMTSTSTSTQQQGSPTTGKGHSEIKCDIETTIARIFPFVKDLTFTSGWDILDQQARFLTGFISLESVSFFFTSNVVCWSLLSVIPPTVQRLKITTDAEALTMTPPSSSTSTFDIKLSSLPNIHTLTVVLFARSVVHVTLGLQNLLQYFHNVQHLSITSAISAFVEYYYCSKQMVEMISRSCPQVTSFEFKSDDDWPGEELVGVLMLKSPGCRGFQHLRNLSMGNSWMVGALLDSADEEVGNDGEI
ncbi:hypothetical protein HDU76_004754, partial [Blyttiomyces sp. JEL0837]